MADFLKRGLITVGVLGGTAVSLGALGAHALKNQLSGGLITEEQLAGFDTGVRYQMYHALAMLILLALHQFRPSRNLRIAFRLFLLGSYFIQRIPIPTLYARVDRDGGIKSVWTDHPNRWFAHGCRLVVFGS